MSPLYWPRDVQQIIYEPTYGRFMSVDPLWMKYLPLQSYQYAGNRPISLSDPSGLEWYGIDGNGTCECSKDTPTRLVVRIIDEGEDMSVAEFRTEQ